MLYFQSQGERYAIIYLLLPDILFWSIICYCDSKRFIRSGGKIQKFNGSEPSFSHCKLGISYCQARGGMGTTVIAPGPVLA